MSLRSLELLEWFVQFCAEHPEWTAEQFPAGTSEAWWLEQAQECVKKVHP